MAIKFLFHTGSIKRKRRLSRKKRLKKFLFHTGSIKSVYSIIASPHNKFLFHTGSIKSSTLIYSDSVPYEFLFHTGSIKSLRVPTPSRAVKKGFYSILVRLKVVTAQSVIWI